MRVKISGDELNLIERCSLLAPVHLGSTRSTALQETRMILELTDDEIDGLREACIEQQQVAGFDQDYGLNILGQVLQGLIDKLYH